MASHCSEHAYNAENTLKYFSLEYRPHASVPASRVFFPDIDDHIVNVIRDTNAFYERDLLEHLWRVVAHKGTFVDVGANIGNHTLFFARYMASRVVAFEPHPRNYDILTSVVATNQLAHVTTVPIGVSSASGVATLALPAGVSKNAGSFTMQIQVPTEGSVDVPVNTLDQLLKGHNEPITLIKIDVEGHEEHVLSGARGILVEHRPHLIIEAHLPEHLSAIQSQLKPLGYRTLGCFCASPTYHFARIGLARFITKRVVRKVRLFMTGR